jgi:hypothetical protein
MDDQQSRHRWDERMEVLHQERTITMVAIRLTADGQRRIDELASRGKCLGCEVSFTDDNKPIRGLCNACYQAAWRAVKQGKTTDQNLVKTGRMLKRISHGRPLSNPMSKQLAEK